MAGTVGEYELKICNLPEQLKQELMNYFPILLGIVMEYEFKNLQFNGKMRNRYYTHLQLTRNSW